MTNTALKCFADLQCREKNSAWLCAERAKYTAKAAADKENRCTIELGRHQMPDPKEKLMFIYNRAEQLSKSAVKAHAPRKYTHAVSQQECLPRCKQRSQAAPPATAAAAKVVRYPNPATNRHSRSAPLAALTTRSSPTESSPTPPPPPPPRPPDAA